MTDSEFKRVDFVAPNGWKKDSTGTEVLGTKYKPDVSFKKDGKLVCVLESTNTGDRKANIGEMLQAEKAFVEEKTKGYLIFSLSGCSKTSSTPQTLKEYLEPYFRFLRKNNLEYGIQEVFLIQQSDFEEINWEILSERFKQNSECLKVNL